jgi:hypothetical protein
LCSRSRAWTRTELDGVVTAIHSINQNLQSWVCECASANWTRQGILLQAVSLVVCRSYEAICRAGSRWLWAFGVPPGGRPNSHRPHRPHWRALKKIPTDQTNWFSSDLHRPPHPWPLAPPYSTSTRCPPSPTSCTSPADLARLPTSSAASFPFRQQAADVPRRPTCSAPRRSL